MSNGYDLEDIAKHYSKKSDSDIMHLATQNASGLKPGVLEILEKEIQKRNLNPNMMAGAKAQNKEYSIEEVTELAQLLRSLPCPLCGSKTAKLNGTVMHTVKSFVFFSFCRKEPIIACPDCLDRKNDKASAATFLLGWWGIPHGLLKTPVYIYYNIKAKKNNRLREANTVLLDFTLQNVGKIVTYKDDGNKLKQLIQFVEK